jgi:hypothetical protein
VTPMANNFGSDLIFKGEEYNYLSEFIVVSSRYAKIIIRF